MELEIVGARCMEKPNYRITAAELLEKCREFYRDPENERAYQAWKAERERKHEKV